jgi:hypothetical protein
MQLGEEDLDYFVPYVLLGECRREPSGKRQRQSMIGPWMSRQGTLKMRGSDRRLRCAVCIEALTKIGRESVDQAAARVVTLLGEQSAKQVDVIRVAYYEVRPAGQHQLGLFYDSFLRWRQLGLTYDDAELPCILDSYAKDVDHSRMESLSALFRTMRSDPVQVLRNHDWVLAPAKALRDRIESRSWNLPSEMYFLAGRLIELARFYVKVGHVHEAMPLYERALDLWQTYGRECCPDELPEAIGQFRKEMEWARSVAVLREREERGRRARTR